MSSHSTKALPPIPHERRWWVKSAKQSEASPSLLPDGPHNIQGAQSNDQEAGQIVRSFLTANNPFIGRGRQQLKRTILSSGPSTSRYARLVSVGKSNDNSGWRMGSIVSCYAVGFCLVINTAFAICAATIGPASEGVGTVYKGDCDKVKSLDRWLHLLINILGTALLSGSNFNMQCLSSPTRKEVEAAHKKGKWLDIGVPSIKNLLFISKKRVGLWWLLAISTLPLHILWNSVLFSTLQSNDYAVITVNQDFLNGNGPDCPNKFNFSDPILENSYPDVICSMYLAAIANNLTMLEPKDCIKNYGTKLQTHWSNVFVVVNATSPLPSIYFFDKTNSDLHWPSLYDDSRSLETNLADMSIPGWMCSELVEGCGLAELLIDSSHWTINLSGSFATPMPNLLVDHCLAESTVETCKLQYSSWILYVVIASNAIKLFSVIMTLKIIKGHHLITLGDAVASFLIDPDSDSKGGCLATKLNLRLALSNPRPYHRSDIWTSMSIRKKTFWGTREKSLRWRHAPSRRRWVVCIALCSGTLLSAIVLLVNGINQMEVKIWSVGFGSVDDRSLVLLKGSPAVISMALLANLPQVIFSTLYFMYNGLYTCMLASSEWSKYALHKKALRVTSPSHVQRSTYWLQIPYRHAIPLSAACSLMHWLISQSIFLARIDAYDPRQQIELSHAARESGKPQGSISTCGYSVLATLLSIIVGTLMLLALCVAGRRKLDGKMPLVGSCSLAISAACHRPPGDQDAAFKPVQWGAVKHETDQGPGHCCFTTYNVEPPIPGQLYAGFENV